MQNLIKKLKEGINLITCIIQPTSFIWDFSEKILLFCFPLANLLLYHSPAWRGDSGQIVLILS